MTKFLVPRPRLAFRIGVTGARALGAPAIAALRPRLRQLLQAVQVQVRTLAQEAGVRAIYDQAEPLLRVISPLAEGADRLVAEEALALGYQLDAPLPFAREAYEADFPDSVAPFRALLDQAGERVLELDGDRAAQAPRSYEAVGRLVAHNCDLLIAVWDGGPGSGRGGTADIVQYASRFGPPVLWLRADGEAEPVWITEARALRHPAAFAARDEAAWAALARYVEGMVRKPPETDRPTHGFISKLAKWLPPRRADAPLDDFLAERARPRRWLWQAHGRLIAWASRPRPASPPWSEPAVAPGAAGAYWQPFHTAPDELAVGYANRYRSSYVLVFGLAALALVFAVLGLAWHHPVLTGAELLLLVGILAIVLANERRRWQERLIGYRLLAELCRKQQALALLGWSLPPAETARVAAGGAAEPGREAWVGWYFNAALRAAPLAAGRMGPAACAALRDALRASLVQGQAAYHAERARSQGAAAAFFGGWGERLFAGTMVFVGAELVAVWLHWHWVSVLFGVLAAGVPAVSAAFVGIRGYAELELMAEQSHRMGVVMKRAEGRLATQPMDVPLASQELGEEVFDLASDMLRDVAGWTQLFEVKAVGVG